MTHVMEAKTSGNEKPQPESWGPGGKLGLKGVQKQIREQMSPTTSTLCYSDFGDASYVGNTGVSNASRTQLRPQILVQGFAADVEVAGDPCFLLPGCNPLA